MKLADLKRIAIGTKLRNVHSLMGPTPEDKQLREVAKVQSNGIGFKRPDKDELSWLYFPKAAHFRDDVDGFTILDEDETIRPESERDKPKPLVIAAQYKFVKE